LRTNWLFEVLLLLGVVLRVMTWLAYQPALLYTDSYNYLQNIEPLNPQYLDPIGYSLYVLKPLVPLGGIALVAAVQHVAGIGMALLLYRVALRCGARRWLAALVTVPVLLDGYQLQIEQNILSDVWLQVLLVVLLWLLVGRGVPRLPWVALAGLVVGVSMTVRMVAITSIVPVALYVLFVGKQWRIPGGWRKIAVRFGVLAVTFLAVVGAYATYFHAVAGFWGLNTASGNSAYGRAADVADCSKLNLNSTLYQLCPKEPLGQRLGSNYYAHLDSDPNWPGYVPPGETKYDLDRQFAKIVLEKQPWAVAKEVLTDFAKGFILPTHITINGDPPAPLWQFQTTFPVYAVNPADTSPTDAFQQENQEALAYGGQGLHLIEPLARVLRYYQIGGFTPGPLLLGLLIVALVGAFSQRGRRSGLMGGTLLIVGLTIMVLGTAAAFEFSWRYQLPSLVLLPLAGVLGITALLTKPAAEDEPGDFEPVGG
jgi:hypothetical protein